MGSPGPLLADHGQITGTHSPIELGRCRHLIWTKALACSQHLVQPLPPSNNRSEELVVYTSIFHDVNISLYTTGVQTA